MRPFLLTTLLLLLPGSVSAQAGAENVSHRGVAAAGSVLSKWSEVEERIRVHVGGWAGLVFGGHILVGGGGYSMLQRVELPGSAGSTGFDLGMGYGGLMFGYWQKLTEHFTGGANLLAGGGHAEVRGRFVGREVGADNFLVSEPEIYLSYAIFRHVNLGASGGYRFVWGVEDLPRVSGEAFRAFTFTLSLRVGGP